ncbi:MAG: DNA polymerase III subunit delta [Muribaculaceae bacterium]|nr:DNA polymerase III subunit delta [Muribaculaceae bacterium]
MANKDYSFTTILSEISRRNYAPVYILMGEEPYYLDKIVEALERSVVAKEEKDFNQSTFYGAEADIEIVEATARQYPMMSEKRLVILKEAQSMSNAKNALDRLASFVEKPSPTTVLVIVYKGDNLNATSKLIKAAQKSETIIFRSPLIRDYQLNVPIKEYCTSKRISIDDKASALLAEFVGNNLGKLFSEIDKLIVATGGNEKRITCELIEENIGISKDFNNFELTSALAEKNYAKAIRIVDYFKRNHTKNPTAVTTGVLLNFFTKVVLAHFAKDQSDKTLMEVCEIRNSYALKDIRKAQVGFTPHQSIKIISLLRDFDTASKGIGSMQNEYSLLKEMIFKMLTLR